LWEDFQCQIASLQAFVDFYGDVNGRLKVLSRSSATYVEKTVKKRKKILNKKINILKILRNFYEQA
jgi:hypothetical protein